MLGSGLGDRLGNVGSGMVQLMYPEWTVKEVWLSCPSRVFLTSKVMLNGMCKCNS